MGVRVKFTVKVDVFNGLRYPYTANLIVILSWTLATQALTTLCTTQAHTTQVRTAMSASCGKPQFAARRVYRWALSTRIKADGYTQSITGESKHVSIRG